MQVSKNKTMATLIALFLVLTIAVTLIALPVANAHTPPWTFPTWTYLTISYNPIGVNQQTLFVFWADKYPPTATGVFGDHWFFTVGVTAPDGSKETLGPFESDPVGGTWTSYTPTQTGTYTVVAHFLEHKVTGLPAPPPPGGYFMGTDAYINDTYLASDSDPVELIVQEQPVQPWSEAPLPTQFWTRPINNMNREWWQLAGNWLAGAAQNVGPTAGFGYGEGPESAHVMWATPMATGGIMDARFDNEGYAGIHYEGLGLTPPIILDGKLFYNVQSQPREGWYCLDLYTGETLYFHNTTGPATIVPGAPSAGSIAGESLAFGQVFIFECPNQHGGFPYLWSTSGPTANTWMMFDAYSGNYICSIANVSASGTAVYGKDGSILRYSIAGSGANQYLRCWNTTHAIHWKGTQQMWDNNDWSGYMYEHFWYWRPALNKTYDGTVGFSLNVSLAANPLTVTTIRAVREDEFVIGGSAGSNNEQGITQGYLWALNLDQKGKMGSLLWNRTFTPPSSAGNLTISLVSVDPEDGVFVFTCRQTRQWWGYSLETGKLLWGPSASEHPMNFYGIANHIYQGKLLTWGYGGVLMAYDIKTGAVVWNYTATNVGFESPYGNYPMGIGAIADGKIYAGTCEHSPGQPLFRGSYLRCINASNGAELWKFSLFGVTLTGGASGSNFAISDGYLVALNNYDNQIYCFGKGPSATTVTASPKTSVHGTSVVIEGIVTDQCAGAKEIAQKLGFANGVPAIADADMQAWMEYLYEQQAMPTNASGVEVTLDTLDPNGNFVHIGTTHSDISGMFSYMWEPEVPGKYTVIATFAGSAAYYSSYAETAIGVDEAPPATAAPEYPQPIDNTWTIVGVGIAMIIAVAIAAIWIKKK